MQIDLNVVKHELHKHRYLTFYYSFKLVDNKLIHNIYYIQNIIA